MSKNRGGKYMAEEQKKSVNLKLAELTSMAARIEEMCGRTHLPEINSIRSVLDSNALLATVVNP